MNTGRKGTRRHNKLTKGINLLLLIATLTLSITGIQVQAANNDDKIVIRIRIVEEEIPEEEIETENAEVEIAETATIEVEADEAPSYTAEADVLDSISENELYYLAECVQIEAGGESFEGKVAVASVLINRVNSASFPNSYSEVVSQKQNGTYQFSSYSSSVWGKKEIAEETYEAIRTALTDGSNVGNATYFANLNEVKSGWFYTAQENETIEKVAEIGGHSFFKTN